MLMQTSYITLLNLYEALLDIKNLKNNSQINHHKTKKISIQKSKIRFQSQIRNFPVKTKER